jgi:hypothetical protein
MMPQRLYFLKDSDKGAVRKKEQGRESLVHR